ncbi:MAG: hypothetical protein KBS96_08950 [Lachnospiraceae bacterium]|nr:hypothetical protein [Candidatus Colinaster scatohippi]
MADKKEININENMSAVEMNEVQQTGLLVTLEKLQKKQLFYQRVSSFLILVFVLSFISILPTVFSTLKSAGTALDNANTAILQAQVTLEDVSDLAVSSQSQINGAMDKLNSIDFESLNEAIRDLQAIVEPMADLFGKR